MLCFGVAHGQNRSEKPKPEIGQSQLGMTDTAYRLQGYAYSFSGGRSGGLVFPSLSEYSIVYCDPPPFWTLFSYSNYLTPET